MPVNSRKKDTRKSLHRKNLLAPTFLLCFPSSTTMLKLIKFIYTDEVEDVDFDLLLAADHFKIPRLFATCELKLCEFENDIQLKVEPWNTIKQQYFGSLSTQAYKFQTAWISGAIIRKSLRHGTWLIRLDPRTQIEGTHNWIPIPLVEPAFIRLMVLDPQLCASPFLNWVANCFLQEIKI